MHFNQSQMNMGCGNYDDDDAKPRKWYEMPSKQKDKIYVVSSVLIGFFPSRTVFLFN